jgi:hypothetical protein
VTTIKKIKKHNNAQKLSTKQNSPKPHKQRWNRPKIAQTEANQPKYYRKREEPVEILMNCSKSNGN